MTDHLSHEDLVMYLDGELPRRTTRKATAHIQSCWSCATELERLKGVIGLILAAQNQVLFPAAPSPAHWPPIEPRLASAHAPPRRWWKWPALQRSAWATAALAVAVVVGAFWPTPVRVSAQEMLRRIAASDGPRTAPTSGRFVRQRVRVVRTERRTRRSTAGTLDSWRSVGGTYWRFESSDAASFGLQGRYWARHLDQLPLSPEVYRVWAADAGGAGNVVQDGGAFEVSFGAGTSLELRLWADRATSHVARMEVGFADDKFELQEQELAVLSARDVPPDVMAHLAPARSGVSRRPGLSHVEPRHADASSYATAAPVDADTAEMEVLRVLHEAGADLGEPIDVIRASNARVVVRIWGVTPERREFLIQLLKNRPGVEIEAASAVATLRSTDLTAQSPAEAPAARTDDDRRLLEWFGSVQIQEDFTRSALANATNLLARLYAINRLAARWQSPREAGLSAANRRKLDRLVADHARAAESNCAELGFLLRPMLDAFLSPAELPTGGTVVQDWQLSAKASLDGAKSLDRALRGLLTTSDEALPLDQALPLIRARLTESRRQVHALAVSIP